MNLPGHHRAWTVASGDQCEVDYKWFRVYPTIYSQSGNAQCDGRDREGGSDEKT